ncbi:MAG: formylglycine-generating enzyme family protein [Victivallales bacterium]
MNRCMKATAVLGVAGMILCGNRLVAAETPVEETTSTGIRMVLIPGGSFNMGDAKGQEDEKPVHKVTVDSFHMDACEVTQESFETLTGINPSKFRDKKGPVERTRWTDAVKYCNARSLKEGLKPCYNTETWECDFKAGGYRLPTEAEWEYACRAGSADERFFKGGESQLDLYAWYRNNSAEKVHAAGTKKPNAFGLSDMYGNVSEWCNDFYNKGYYSASAEVNPVGPKTGDKRVLRGGNWSSRPKDCKSFRRFADNPVTADICQGYDTYGFRCVRRVKGSENY